MSLTMLFDGLLVALLIATLVYVARLNRRLDRLRDGRAEFEALIARFAQSTEQADRGMVGMKQLAAAEGKALQAMIDRAVALRDDLMLLVDRANGLADRLEAGIARSRQGAARSPMPSAGTVTRFAPRPSVTEEAAAPKTLSTGEHDLLKALASVR